jgi:hypothetical protein
VDVVITGNNDLSSFSGYPQTDDRYHALVKKVHDDTIRAGKIFGQASANYATGPYSYDARSSRTAPRTTATYRRGAAAVDGDEEAVAHLRGILAEYPPSSPSIALFKNGKPVYVMHRRDIEPRDAFQIAQALREAFEQHCV